MQRDGHLKSLWQNTQGTVLTIGTLDPTAAYDVVIVGAGITGCSTAFELAKAGKKCLLVEAHDIGFGTTGGTTAHLNTILDHSYAQITSGFGLSASQLVARGLRNALDLVAKNVADLQIDCGHSWQEGFLFSQTSVQTGDLDEIFRTTKEAGVNVLWSKRLPVPRTFQKVMAIERQAQIHPLRYIAALVTAYTSLGGHVLKGCRVNKVEDNEPLQIHTTAGMIVAHALIYATHTPPGINLLHFRCAPYRSYVVSAELNDQAYPDGLVYDMEDPYHYYRTQEIDGKRHLIVGGEDHKTGHKDDTRSSLEDLISHVKEHYDIANITASWSSQYFETPDGLPYIGSLPGYSDRVLVATGFSGNGITLGVLSAIAFTEFLTKGQSLYTDLFNPGRVKPLAGAVDFFKENADVVRHFLSKPFLADRIEGVDDLVPGEGRLVKLDGEQLGIYKDPHGALHAINPLCPHAMCTVKWNGAERSWDCPCHGSRFSIDGTLLTGPATLDLERRIPE